MPRKYREVTYQEPVGPGFFGKLFRIIGFLILAVIIIGILA